MRFEGAQLKAYIHIAGAYATPVGGANIKPNEWYHTAATFNGQVVQVYLIGEVRLLNQHKISLWEAKPMGISQTSHTYFFGIIDEVLIRHIARMPDEVKEGIEETCSSGKSQRRPRDVLG